MPITLNGNGTVTGLTPLPVAAMASGAILKTFNQTNLLLNLYLNAIFFLLK